MKRLLLLFGVLIVVPTIASAQLPQTEAYMTTGREWMSTLQESDFDVSRSAFSWSYRSGMSDDALLREHRALRNPNSNSTPSTYLARIVSSRFLLSSIVANGVTNIYPNYETLAYWLTLDFPGNVYASSSSNATSIKNRMMTMAWADLIMWDQYTKDEGAKVYRLGMAGVKLTESFLAGKNVMPADVQSAFKAGLLRLFGHIESQGAPRSVNENMDSFTLRFFYNMKRIFGSNQNIAARAFDLAKTWLVGSTTASLDQIDDPGKALFRSGGWVVETNGPETTYNGLSYEQIAHVALMAAFYNDSQWLALFAGAADRMARFIAIQSYKDNDDKEGYYDGPSGYAARTADSQLWGQGQKYEAHWATAVAVRKAGISPNNALAFLTDRWHSGSRRNVGIFSVQDMRVQIQEKVSNVNSDLDYPNSSGATPSQWDPGDGQNQFWPDKWPFTFTFLPDGTYADIQNLLVTGDPSLFEMPNDRSESYNLAFQNGTSSNSGPEFWAVKGSDGQRDFAFFVETISEQPWGYKDRWKIGGSLQALWFEDIGIIVLSKSKGARDKDPFTTVENWATNHIWGRDEQGNPFSSARSTDLVRDYGASLSSNPRVVVRGRLGQYKDGLSAPNGALTGQVDYTRTFTQTSTGLTVTTALTSDGSDLVSALTETIPIYLRDKFLTADAQIHVRVDGLWQDATTVPQFADAVRIRRPTGDAFIAFDTLRTVRLAPNVWTTTYQTSNRIRNLHIDLLDGTPTPVSIPSNVSIRYSFSAIEPAIVPVDPGTGDPDTTDPPPNSPPTEAQTMDLDAGWNFVSSYVNPADSTMEWLLRDIINEVVVVKDFDGNSYDPAISNNTLLEWIPTKAYMINMRNPVSLSIEGLVLTPEEITISLQEGWNLVPYSRRTSTPVEIALASLLPDLIMVKDRNGRVFYPQYGINDIVDLLPGEGYKVLLSRDSDLVYLAND